MGSMLDMLKNMMDGGRDVGEGQQPGNKPGDEPGEQPGQGGEQPGQGGKGGSQGGNKGDPDNTAENSSRRVPRNSGTAGSSMPKEFHQAMDAYNRGVNDKAVKP